jgi:hypothetical protein
MANRVLRSFLTVALVAGLCLATQNAYFLRLAKTEYTLFTTLLSVTVVLVRIRHSGRDLALLALATVALLAIAVSQDHSLPGIPLTLSLIGLASLAVLGGMAIWSRGASRPALFCGFGASVVLISSGWILPLLLTWVARSNPKSFDLYLLSFDASLRFQPSFLLGAAFLHWPLLARTSSFFYMGIMCLCTLVFADHLKRNVKKAVSIFSTFLLSGPIGIFFYNLFPARGPLYLFNSNFPGRPLPLEVIRHFHLEPVPVYGFPNAIPSLHMAWALLAFWYSRDASVWVRTIASIFLVFTVCSTLGSGEHYLVDLVVALPFALMLQAACAFSAGWTDPWRIRSAVFGAAATILWMTLLRFQPGYFWVTPLTPWALILATTVATLFFEKRLSESGRDGELTAGFQQTATVPSLPISSDSEHV